MKYKKKNAFIIIFEDSYVQLYITNSQVLGRQQKNFINIAIIVDKAHMSRWALHASINYTLEFKRLNHTHT